jgi:hypothetical protein
MGASSRILIPIGSNDKSIGPGNVGKCTHPVKLSKTSQDEKKGNREVQEKESFSSD